jgi:hypothetical protein
MDTINAMTFSTFTAAQPTKDQMTHGEERHRDDDEEQIAHEDLLTTPRRSAAPVQ